MAELDRILAEPPVGWMAGVFRQLRHWVEPDARSTSHQFGVTYYAVCGSPCLHAPDVRRIWARWPNCADCAASVPARTIPSGQWGTGVLQRDVVHAWSAGAVSDGGAGFALCGTWLIAPGPDPTDSTRVRACSSCLHLLDEQAAT
ncbi:hypothetical protein [Actinokineospora sp.]|uniref:hypothetical protein n=1 Tax=Actinokineospora sp. TaxID=1872133 RepID=UPI0040382778